MSEDVFVDYEYGDLKEVIVGVPFTLYPDLSVAKWATEALRGWEGVSPWRVGE